MEKKRRNSGLGAGDVLFSKVLQDLCSKFPNVGLSEKLTEVSNEKASKRNIWAHLSEFDSRMVDVNSESGQRDELCVDEAENSPKTSEALSTSSISADKGKKQQKSVKDGSSPRSGVKKTARRDIVSVLYALDEELDGQLSSSEENLDCKAYETFLKVAKSHDSNGRVLAAQFLAKVRFCRLSCTAFCLCMRVCFMIFLPQYAKYFQELVDGAIEMLLEMAQPASSTSVRINGIRSLTSIVSSALETRPELKGKVRYD